VKHRDLIKKIESLGAVFIRHGGRHDWYQKSGNENLAAGPEAP